MNMVCKLVLQNWSFIFYMLFEFEREKVLIHFYQFYKTRDFSIYSNLERVKKYLLRVIPAYSNKQHNNSNYLVFQ